jgi:hypothetical protein
LRDAWEARHHERTTASSCGFLRWVAAGNDAPWSQSFHPNRHALKIRIRTYVSGIAPLGKSAELQAKYGMKLRFNLAIKATADGGLKPEAAAKLRKALDDFSDAFHG